VGDRNSSRRDTVSDDNVAIGMSLPLDSDGFLRRECPTCEREFKWLYTPYEAGAEALVSDGGYYCPYCGVQAPPNSWLTQAQVVLAQNAVATEVVGPMIEKLSKDMSRTSSGMISVSMQYKPPEKMDPLTEVDDMRRADFTCHASEPVKVLDEWDREIYCLICGATTS
jgi:DNA-directed RNA polymerase subunit RPC12/RpoP